MSKYIWTPSQDFLNNSNVARFMKKYGIKDYRELIEKSTSDIEWFWSTVEKELNIHWFRPYERVLDTSKGIMWAKWFIGGKINLTYNCVEKHAKGEKRSKPALIWESEDGMVVRLSYEELNNEVNKLASALKELGVRKGDRVGIYMPMIPEAVIASFAIPKIGAIYIPIFSGFGPAPISSRLNDASAKILIVADGFLRRGRKINMKETVDKALESSPTVEKVLIFRRLGEKIRMNSKRDIFIEEVVKERVEVKTEEMDSEAPFLLAYTSGTTGKPKGSVHVHGGFLVKIAEEVAFQVDMKEDDILFWLTEMGWIMGPWETVGAGCLGKTVFLYEGAPDYPHPGRLWELIERHGISILGISPTAIRALRRYGEDIVKKYNLDSLRVLGSTGEPWDEESYIWFFEKIGQRRCPIINLSGGTEVGACFLSPHPIAPLKPCTLQGPALGMAIDIYDEHGRPLKEGVGELVALKPWPGMTRGIWRDEARYIETYWSRWENVWVHGDWASRDEDGLWYLHGRSDDTIKVAGKRIGPAEVETVVNSHPLVVESAVIGIPDEVKGEAIVVFAILKDKAQVSQKVESEISELIVKKLSKTMKPKMIMFVDELPKTRNAKIMRRIIKNKFLGKDVGDTSTLENPQAIKKIPLLTNYKGE